MSSASRAWLLANATAVLYPSSAEGFGFVPYEAAVLGTPSTFTDFGPLREVSGVSGLPSTWSVEAHARDLVALLSDGDARRDRLDQLLAAVQRSTWTGFAGRLAAFFELVKNNALVDLFREKHPEPGRFTWWDYRAGAFHKNQGLRIDHFLVSEPLVARCREVEVDREARKGKLPSDHAPVWAEFA